MSSEIEDCGDDITLAMYISILMYAFPVRMIQIIFFTKKT